MILSHLIPAIILSTLNPSLSWAEFGSPIVSHDRSTEVLHSDYLQGRSRLRNFCLNINLDNGSYERRCYTRNGEHALVSLQTRALESSPPVEVEQVVTWQVATNGRVFVQLQGREPALEGYRIISTSIVATSNVNYLIYTVTTLHSNEPGRRGAVINQNATSVLAEIENLY
jgi:hypothetical protein